MQSYCGRLAWANTGLDWNARSRETIHTQCVSTRVFERLRGFLYSGYERDYRLPLLESLICGKVPEIAAPPLKYPPEVSIAA
jgi:hypothetical protein